jgi:hypothetical protein
MQTEPSHPEKRPFYCEHCNGKILVPRDLPPTTGPCPHCGHTITSPALAELASPVEPTPDQEKLPVPDPNPEVSELSGSMVQNTNSGDIDSRPAKCKNKSPIVVIVALAAIACGIWYLTHRAKRVTELPQPSNPASNSARILDDLYINSGWIEEARTVLDSFQRSKTAGEKMEYVNPVLGLQTRMREYYGGGIIDDSDTPASAFQASEVPAEDRKKGLFWMTFEEIPQTDVQAFFRPILTLEARYGLEPLDAASVLGDPNSENLTEPIKVLAFFKHGADGLKLDWDVYAQTKYRTLRGFTEYAQAGQSVMLRVLIEEDVPEKAMLVTGTRTYRLTDPMHQGDHAKVNVEVDSEIGRKLSLLNWRGTEVAEPLTRTATVELEWTSSGQQPRLQMKRFVCWEFLGLGGDVSPH